MHTYFSIIFFFLTASLWSQSTVGGVVYTQEHGVDIPLAGASVYWQSTAVGGVTDEQGAFQINRHSDTNVLVIQYLGFQTATLVVTKTTDTIIQYLSPKEGESLNEVEVVQRKKTLQKSYLEAQNVMTVSSAELLKAACCNLSESFETNPSIDINFSDALTGTKQIKMLGLSSPYVLIAEENIPSVRGAAQVYGMTFTPGTWVESIQITKGAGSVINGFESIAGQINTELKKPFSDSPFFLNLFTSGNGRQEGNLHLNRTVSSRWSTGAYLHANRRGRRTDNNADGFLDMPLANQFNVMNRWQYTHPEKGIVGFFNWRYLADDKQTGALDFSPATDRFTTNHWGSEIKTRRMDAALKTGYVFPLITYQSMGLQMAYSQHEQEAYFGLRQYDITHRSFFSSFLFNSILGNTLNKFKSGLSFYWDHFDETVDAQIYQRTDRSVGAFFEYTYDGGTAVQLVAGLRLDHHNRLGTFLTPRLHLRYTPWERSVLRFSVGQGRKAANIFAENQPLFATNRSVLIAQQGGNIYGLDPEIAWNYGGSIRQGFSLFNQQGDVTFDLYITDFVNQVVVDWERARYIEFYNLEGASQAQSLQLSVDYVPLRNTALRLAYKNYRVETTYRSGKKQMPLQPRHRFFANVEYNNVNGAGRGWRADMTLHQVGAQRLPDNPRDGAGFRSAPYGLLQAQWTRVFSPKIEVYVGGENLTNVQQTNPLIGVDQPFGRNFDASLVVAPIFGRVIYAGLRFNLK